MLKASLALIRAVAIWGACPIDGGVQQRNGLQSDTVVRKLLLLRQGSLDNCSFPHREIYTIALVGSPSARVLRIFVMRGNFRGESKLYMRFQNAPFSRNSCGCLGMLIDLFFSKECRFDSARTPKTRKRKNNKSDEIKTPSLCQLFNALGRPRQLPAPPSARTTKATRAKKETIRVVVRRMMDCRRTVEQRGYGYVRVLGSTIELHVGSQPPPDAIVQPMRHTFDSHHNVSVFIR